MKDSRRQLSPAVSFRVVRVFRGLSIQPSGKKQVEK